MSALCQLRKVCSVAIRRALRTYIHSRQPPLSVRKRERRTVTSSTKTVKYGTRLQRRRGRRAEATKACFSLHILVHVHMEVSAAPLLIRTAVFGAAAGIFAYLHVRRKRSHGVLPTEAACRQQRQRLQKLRDGQDLGSHSGVFYNEADAPNWLRPLFRDPSLRRVLMREWEDVAWRKSCGWRGRDLIHDPVGTGVCVHCYFWNDATKTLTGVVSFGPDAESHRGLCHGGAMTSLMDDLCGHIAFMAPTKASAPWCGATVQVDCKLCKPVHVGDVLKLVGTVHVVDAPNKRGLEKVHITATLLGEDETVYCELKGLSISGFSMHTIEDAVAQRTWLRDETVLRDSGWLLPAPPS